MSPLKEAALEALQQGPATYPELERRTGRNDRSLQWALYALEKDGVVRREKIVYASRRRLDLARQPRVRWMLTGKALPVEQPSRAPLQELVLRHLSDGCSIKELAGKLGTSMKNVGCALRRLEARGVVRQEPVDRAALVGDRRRRPRVRWYWA